jgi:hypothetical protein
MNIKKTLHKLFLTPQILFLELILLALIIGAIFLCYSVFLFGANGFQLGEELTGVYATAWVDENGNGINDHGELPLAGVCIWSGETALAYRESSEDCAKSENITLENGRWAGDLYGNNDLYIFALPPDGYKSSTPPVVKGNDAEFGFVSSNMPLKIQIEPMDVYVQRFLDEDKQIELLTKIGISILLLLLTYVAWKVSEKVVSIK